ncbi:MAG: hypothetical protein KF868_02085 [Acidobacteria bacterium]|nr:hypothetical protein [Acidobacteriota bacterium]MCW5967994.1 hypothetical protein [Blastocatellales bacterium]
MERKKRNTNIVPFLPFISVSSVLTFLLILAFSLALLWTPPIVGLADNGDFFRMLRWGQLAHRTLRDGEVEDRYEGWINREYRFVAHPMLAWKGLPSSEALFVKAAALLALIWPGGGSFDLRLLGLVHALAFAAAATLLLRGWREVLLPSPVLIAGLVVVFCDIGYLVYFQSFYSEAASFIFLLAFVGSGLLLMSGAISRGRTWLFFACAFLLVSAKAQNILLALPLALTAARLYIDAAGDRRLRRIVLAGFTAILLIAAGIYITTPRGMKNANLYNSVFNGFLKWTPSPGAALARLGLDPGLSELAGSNYFQTPVDVTGEEMQQKFFARTGPLAVAGHYLRNPADLLIAMQRTAISAFTLQPEIYGNFERSSGYPYGEKAVRWNLWSRFKQNMLPHSLTIVAVHAGLLLLGIIVMRRGRERNLGEFYFALWLMMCLSFAVPVPGDGENDLEKHLFLYQALFDLSLVIAAATAVRAIVRKLDARRRS